MNENATVGEGEAFVSPPLVRRSIWQPRLYHLVLLLALVASGCNNATAPDVLHIAGATYTRASACGQFSCVATIRFRLLNQRMVGRSGKVIASSQGGIIGQTTTTDSDGRGVIEWGFEPLNGMSSVTICPAEVHDAVRCAYLTVF